MTEKILITGVSGFVGRNIAKTLLSNPNYEIYGLSRTNPHLEGITYVQGDVRLSQKHLISQFRDATIIHCAASTEEGDKNSSVSFDTNVQGTRNMIDVNDQGKFIHISSSSIYNLQHASNNVEEKEFSSGKYKFYNQYGSTKAHAEFIVLNTERAIPAISLRPHAVYGADDTTLFPRIKERINNGKLVLPGGGKTYHSLTHISNLVQAVEKSLKYTPTQPEAFNVTDAQPVLLRTALCAVFDKELQTIKNIPVSVALALAKTGKISTYEIKQLGYNRTYSLDKAKDKLGYTPTVFTDHLKDFKTV